MKTLTWQKPGQQNVAQELIKIIINYVAELRESTTTASKQDQERTEVDETLSITLQQFSNRLDTISNKVNALLNQREKVVELSWWDLHKDKVYCYVIGLILAGWLVCKFKK